MPQYKVSLLAYGTTFKLGGKSFVLCNTTWSTKAPAFPIDDLITRDGEDTGVIECNPILGNQVQTSIRQWVRRDTLVTVE